MLKKWLDNMTVQQKMILIYGVVGFVPIVILFLFCSAKMNQILTDRETTNIQSFLYQSKEQMDNQLAIYNNLSDYISFNESIAQVLGWDDTSENEMSDLGTGSNYELYEQITNVVDPLLNSIKYFHEDVEQATIYTGVNTVEHDTLLAPITSAQETFWYRDVVETQNILWYVNKEKKEVFSARKMPMLEKKSVLGIFYLKVNYEKLFQVFEQSLYHNFGLFIVDENNQLIYENHNFDEDNEKRQLEYEQLEDDIVELEGKNNVITVKKQDENYLLVREQSNKTGWTIAFYMPSELIVGPTQPLKALTVLTMILAVAAAGIALVAFSRLIGNRLRKLQKMMSEVEEGRLDFEMAGTNTNGDEIDDLFRSFGKMISQIKILIQEVYQGEIRQKQYEMRALQAQINPHFLYNSLSLINWKALEAEQSDISKITLALSTFYRTSLNKGGNLLRVADEINNCKSYLEIQLYMHDYEFEVEFRVEEEILDCETINLILQPLVENAIEHGIDLKEDGERGKLIVSGYRDGEKIILKVEDNGVGIEPEKTTEMLSVQSKGYGVRNVNERIQLQYGNAYGLQVKSKPGTGTAVFIHLPYIK